MSSVETRVEDRLPVNIRVVKNGSRVQWELMVDGMKVADLTRSDIANMTMQFASSLRWE